MDQVNSLLSSENTGRVGRILENLESVSEEVEGITGGLDNTGQQFDDAISQVDGVLTSAESTSRAGADRRADFAVNEERPHPLRSSIFTSRWKPIARHADAIASNLETTTRNMDEFSQQIREDPARHPARTIRRRGTGRVEVMSFRNSIGFVASCPFMLAVAALADTRRGWPAQSGPAPRDHYYRTRNGELAVGPGASPLLAGTIEVDRLRVEAIAQGRRASCTAKPSGASELSQHAYHHWADPPNLMLQDQLVALPASRRPSAERVVTPAVHVASDYLA